MTTDISNICTVVKKIAWGFFLVLIAINFGTIDILPDWAGYILMVSALPVLATQEKSANLLRPFGIILVIWNMVVWVLKIFSLNGYISYISVIPAAVGMYFTFQLLTNLATIAEKYACPQSKSLIRLRTFNVIFTVISTLLIYMGFLDAQIEIVSALTIGLSVVAVILIIAMLITLFSFSKSLQEKDEQLKEELQLSTCQETSQLPEDENKSE